MSYEFIVHIPEKTTFNERDIPRFNKETIIRRIMNVEARLGRAFSNDAIDLDVVADVVLRLYEETGHRQQNPMTYK